MGHHPPELDRRRYRWCCCHVNEGVLIIAILGVIFTSPYNPISFIAHILLLIGYATKNHRFFYFYVVLEIISCVFLVLVAISCVMYLVETSGKRPGYAWYEEPIEPTGDFPPSIVIAFICLLLIALVLQIWFILVVRRAMEFLKEKKKLKKAKGGKKGFVATPNVFVAQQPITSYPPSTSAQPPYAPGYAPPASAPQPGPSTPYPAHDASYPTKNPRAYPHV